VWCVPARRGEDAPPPGFASDGGGGGGSGGGGSGGGGGGGGGGWQFERTSPERAPGGGYDAYSSRAAERGGRGGGRAGGRGRQPSAYDAGYDIEGAGDVRCMRKPGAPPSYAANGGRGAYPPPHGAHGAAGRGAGGPRGRAPRGGGGASAGYDVEGVADVRGRAGADAGTGFDGYGQPAAEYGGRGRGGRVDSRGGMGARGRGRSGGRGRGEGAAPSPGWWESGQAVDQVHSAGQVRVPCCWPPVASVLLRRARGNCHALAEFMARPHRRPLTAANRGSFVPEGVPMSRHSLRNTLRQRGGCWARRNPSESVDLPVCRQLGNGDARASKCCLCRALAHRVRRYADCR